MSTCSTSWNRYFFTWSEGKCVVHWLERQHCGVKKCHEHIAIKVLTLNVVLNQNTGFSAPHVVALSSSSTHGTCRYEILGFREDSKPNQNSWQMVSTFEAPKQLCPSRTKFHLLDGPSVVMSVGSCIYLASGSSMKPTSLSLNSVLPNNNIDDIMRVWCESQQGPTGSIQLGVQARLKKVAMGEFADREWYSVEVDVSGTPALALVPGSVPGCYGMIATCMTTYTEFVLDHHAGLLTECVWRVIGTELKQVVMVEDGLVVGNVLTLDHVPQKLSTLTSPTGHLIVAVKFAIGEVSAHELLDQPDNDGYAINEGRKVGKECLTWKRVGEWTRVQDMHTGDFMQTGSSQLLLLLSDSDEFVLTNFSDIAIPDCSTSANQDESIMEDSTSQTLLDCPASLLNTLKGLQLKKHAGEAQLVQYEAMEQQKLQLLTKSLSFMETLAQDTSSIPPPDPGLLTIVHGELDEPSCIKLPEVTSQNQRHFEVLNIWQKLCDGQWIIGLLAKNVSQRPLIRLSMSLIAAEQQLVTDVNCMVMWNETSQKSADIGAAIAEKELVGAPLQKRRKCDSGTSEEAGNRITCERLNFIDVEDSVCLVVHSDLVLPDSKAVLIVSWTEVTTAGLEITASEELTHIKLDRSELSGGHLNIDKSCLQLWTGGRDMKRGGRPLCVQDFSRTDVQSLTSLLALHLLTQIHVTSKYTYLWRLPSVLKAKFPCSPNSIQVSPPLFWQQQKSWRATAAAPPCLVSSPDLGGLGLFGATGLHVLIETGSAVISVLHRRTCDRLSLVKLLKDSLPQDMTTCLLTDSPSKEHDRLHAGLSAMVEEANGTAKNMRNLLVSDELHSSTLTQQLVTSTNTALANVHL